jgi:predicted ATPase
MINHLKIKQFKCIDAEEFSFQNLTILTGLNSAGKSSVIQSILLMSHYFGQKKFLSENIISFAINSNMYVNAKEFSITLNEACLTKNIDETNQQGSLPNFTNEQDIFHIDANRLGPEELALYSSENKIGKHGEFIFSYYEQHKNKAIEKSLVKSESSDTLQSNIDYWLSYILDEKVELNTERVTSSHVKVTYKFNLLATAMSPESLGAGTSYVVKVLIVCLLAKPGNILLIENPEIHLHPKAQAKLGEFFAFVASHGVQVVVETHCENLINRVTYEVYDNRIMNDDCIIYYKENSQEPFQKIAIDKSGHFINHEDNEIINFPTGFFDSTLEELLKIG